MNTNEIWQGIQSYSKSQVAGMYMPDIEPKSALRNLNAWIKQHPTLEQDLMDAGVSPKTLRYKLS